MSLTDLTPHPAAPLRAWASLPDTCAVESEADECGAAQIGPRRPSRCCRWTCSGGGRAVDVGGGASRLPCARHMPLQPSEGPAVDPVPGVRLARHRVRRILERRANRRGACCFANAIPRGPQSRRASACAVLRAYEALFNTPHLFSLAPIEIVLSGMERSARPPSVQGVHSLYPLW